jgi:hypothetical protein
VIPEPGRPRVFGIGLNKTGTSSLHEALTILGYRSLHWGGPPTRRLVERALAEGRPLLTHLDPDLEAFSDIEPLYRNFALVDQQYPGSRFVLTLRPMDEWLESRRRHVERNQVRKAAGEYDGVFLEVDLDGWAADWEQHVTSVRRHFSGRDDLLELDLTQDARWDDLSAFVGVPLPERPFPWANRGTNPR